MPASTPQKLSVAAGSTAGCTCTTITAAIPPSEANRPSLASTSSLGPTASDPSRAGLVARQSTDHLARGGRASGRLGGRLGSAVDGQTESGCEQFAALLLDCLGAIRSRHGHHRV